MKLLLTLTLLFFGYTAEATCGSNAIEDFVFLGDTGTGEKDQLKVAAGIEAFCATNKCDFGLLLGDNIYEKGVKDIKDSQWKTKLEEPYKNLGFRFYPALGNHDHKGNAEAQVAYQSARWSLPAKYYHRETKYADLYTLDTDDLTKAQLNWLDQALSKSSKTWRIVYGHHPIYSNGEHGRNGEMNGLKKSLLPILRKHNVQFYLAGHDHNLEVIEQDGAVFIVSGAGAKLRPLQTGSDTVWGKSQLGFSHFDLEEDSAKLRMLDDKGQTIWEKIYQAPEAPEALPNDDKTK